MNLTINVIYVGTSFISNNSNNQQVTCECKKNISYLELEVVTWLKSLNIEIIQSNRSLIAPLELDIYIPTHNLAIEFNRPLLT